MVFSEMMLSAAAPEDVPATYCMGPGLRASEVRRPSGPGSLLVAPGGACPKKAPPPYGSFGGSKEFGCTSRILYVVTSPIEGASWPWSSFPEDMPAAYFVGVRVSERRQVVGGHGREEA